MRSDIKNIRTKVDKRQIIQYLLLRERILGQKIQQPTKGEDRKELKKRHSEIVKLIKLIADDGIDKEIRKMHQYIHRQNDYLKSLKDGTLQSVGEQDG